MGQEYGVRIKNFSAGQLYEYGLGVRDYLPYTNAMLTNSLFLDFLLQNGLKVSKNGYTRDVICINFDMGAKGYEKTRKNIENKIKKVDNETKERLQYLLDNVNDRADLYVKKSKEDIRIEYYENGVDIKYITKDKSGHVKKEEIVHYKMLYRSAGKAKQGSVMFIYGN